MPPSGQLVQMCGEFSDFFYGCRSEGAEGAEGAGPVPGTPAEAAGLSVSVIDPCKSSKGDEQVGGD